MRRRARRGAAIVAVTGLGLAGCGDDGASATPGVEVSDPWARATVPAATTGAVYLVLEAATDDALIAARVDRAVAAAVTLHQTVSSAPDDEGHGTDMVMMTDLAELALPAGDDVALTPGGTHLMLSDLARPLTAGASFEVTLSFASAPDRTVTVEVRDDP